jgi:hypothetical protein
MHAVGNNDLVTDISSEKYRLPSGILFKNAARVLRGYTKNYDLVEYPKNQRKLGHEEIVRVFDTVFDELGLKEWSVNESINIAKQGVKVGVKKKEVLVYKDIERTPFKLRKTIVHEVGTHVLRAHNGERTGFEALSKANLSSYLDIEEGLAMFNEMKMGLLTERWLKNKAAMAWAIYLGRYMSFRELYNVMLGALPKKTAFNVVYRVKRGLADTSYPGIYAKDSVYFRGFRRVKRKLEREPRLYNQLYAGKIDFKQCVWVEEGLIRKPSILPPTKEEWDRIFKKVGI